MNILHEQVIELLKDQKSLTSDNILQQLFLPVTNNNRLFLASIIQKEKLVQLEYIQQHTHVVRSYSLKEILL